MDPASRPPLRISTTRADAKTGGGFVQDDGKVRVCVEGYAFALKGWGRLAWAQLLVACMTVSAPPAFGVVVQFVCPCNPLLTVLTWSNNVVAWTG